MSSVAEKWRDALKTEGYEHHVSGKDLESLKKFGRVWRRILRYTKIEPSNANVFEAGCGGGKHLIPFALRGSECVGLDFSGEVLSRAKKYIGEVSSLLGKSLSINFIEGDFLNYNGEVGKYDLVFHVGVIEHFMDDAERLTFLKNMFNIAKPGGYVISIVPSGAHPLREKMKNLKLGGYGIPEVDYNEINMKEEFEKCGGKEIKIIPHNLFGYLLIDNSSGIKKIIQKLAFYFFQIIPPSVFPYKFGIRHSGTLIGISKK